MSYPAKDRLTREEDNSRWLHRDTGMWRYLLWGIILLGGSYREEISCEKVVRPRGGLNFHNEAISSTSFHLMQGVMDQ